jgi:hypothetical protein
MQKYTKLSLFHIIPQCFSYRINTIKATVQNSVDLPTLGRPTIPMLKLELMSQACAKKSRFGKQKMPTRHKHNPQKLP